MKTKTIQLCEKMFPEMQRLPAFSALGAADVLESEELETALKSYCESANIDLQNIEVNWFLKGFKKQYSQLVNQFIADVLDFFFTHPDVLASLQNGRKTLFPNQRTLPEIDFDLVIPVFERMSDDE
ncbi:hypothetical protein XMA121_000129 [Marinobacterium sp. xm-a-121]|uniref:hypothetical protein n=1 Tax=unclassified Marinobacterium TaxID=2644139 RepID=UPI00156A3612|nr:MULTISPECIES: hypothetical protein [unclassified Marinobacterium]NRP37544.1 hypothetical protein [Marinobacterium sp. xm-a-121]NRP99888.1 hypothetical protein [Marinobacterium sp. xm-v-233]